MGDSGVGSASNSVSLQVGGALGVAVIGSVMSTRYQQHMTTDLAGWHVSPAITNIILGSLGGALTVAGKAGASPAHCWPMPRGPRSWTASGIALRRRLCRTWRRSLVLFLLPSRPAGRHRTTACSESSTAPPTR